MTFADSPSLERLEDLLADRATQGLSVAEHAELAWLMREHPDVDPDCFDRIVAALQMAEQMGRELATDMSAGLRRSIEDAGIAEVQSRRSAATPIPSPTLTVRSNRVSRSGSPFSSVGWIAAAACLTVAVLGWWPRLMGINSQMGSPDSLLAKQGSVTTSWAYWSPKPPAEDPQAHDIDWAQQVKGRVIWNSDTQQGFMIFDGMKVNDPSVAQYQLWILDKDQKHPVDGGVFNIDRATGAVVRITPKIKVATPIAFAVTIEKPGGVVVSDQHERVVVAGVK